MTAQVPHSLRSDAQENRDRVLEAARTLFAEAGLNVTMREVARRAGVGPATLYRRFPTKQHLVEASFSDELRRCRTIVEEACADPDPWRGLQAVVVRIGELNAGNRGFVDALVSRGDIAALMSDHRARMVRDLAGLLSRAKAAGAVRAEVSLDDLVLLLLAGRGLADGAPALRSSAARRFATLAVAAIAA